MEKRISTQHLFVLATFISALFVLFVFIGKGYSMSVDLAHHYSLVNKFSNDWSISSGYTENLGEMKGYTPLAHIAAAGLSYFTGFGILGMNMLVLLALIATYISLGYFLLRVSFLTLVGGSACIFVLLASNLPLPIVGREIVGNYFFSQFICQAFLLVMLVVLMEHKGKLLPRIALCLVGTVLGYFTHPTFAVIFFGATLIFLFAEIFASKSWQQDLKWWLVYLILGFLVFLFHPYTKSMMETSQNNGWLHFPLLTRNAAEMSNIGYAFIACALAFSGSMLWFFRGVIKDPLTGGRVLLVINAVLFSASSIALLQWFLLLTGKGSQYAVKKYLFVIFTFFLLSVIVFLGRILLQKSKGVSAWIETRTQPWAQVLLPIFGIVSILFALQQPVFSAAHLVELQKQAIHFHQYSATGAQRHNTIAQFDVPAPLNYLITVGDLEYPRGENLSKVILDRTNEVEGETYLFTNQGDPDTAATGVFGRSTLVSLKNHLDPRVKDAYQVVFNTFSSQRFLKGGFSTFEPWGTWTDSDRAEVLFLATDLKSRSIKAEFTVKPWIAPGHENFTTIVTCNNEALGTWSFSPKNSGANDLQFLIPNRLVGSDGSVKLVFNFDNLKSPKSVGLSDDGRNLSLGIVRMLISYQ